MDDIPEFVYQPLSHPASQARVLAIFPGPSDAPLRLGLQFTNLFPGPSMNYNALSYAWGANEATEEVEIRLRHDDTTHCVQCGQELEQREGNLVHPPVPHFSSPREYLGATASQRTALSKLTRLYGWEGVPRVAASGEQDNQISKTDGRLVQNGEEALPALSSQVPEMEPRALPVRDQIEGQSVHEQSPGVQAKSEPTPLSRMEEVFPIRRMMRVTPNLASALRHLRQPDAGWVVWADGICINQADNEEKGHQVRSMDLVYEGARMTTVWLGESADDSALAADLVRELRKYRKTGADSKGCGYRFDMERFYGDTRRWMQHWTALRKVLERPWFQRRWVIQEAILSKYIEVVCGNDTFEWCSLWQVARFLFQENSVHSTIHRLDMLHSYQSFYQKYQREGRTELHTSFTLHHLCMAFFKTRCYDPRDVVYSLLSLSRDLQGDQLFPDYSSQMTTQKLFAQCFVLIVTNSQSLDIILSSQHSPSDPVETWLPCLGGNARPCRCGTLGGDEGVNYNLFYSARLHPPGRNASLSTTPEYRIEEGQDRYTLVVAGHVVGPVAYAGNGIGQIREQEAFKQFCEETDLQSAWDEFYETMKDASPSTRVLNEQSTIALSNGPAERGDVVCLLLGCSSPVVLRPYSPGNVHEFYFICGVSELANRIMDGSFMQLCLDKDVAPQEFVLH